MQTWNRVTRPGVPLGIALGLGVAAIVAVAGDVTSHFEFRSYQEVADLFVELDYTPEAWQAGIREVPRVYLTNIPERWRTTTSKEVSVLNKKRIFFRALAPLVLRANELILAERERLDSVRANRLAGLPISEQDEVWLRQIAESYDVDIAADGAAGLEELWKRVDMIPAALALSQGAEESGWGTSRFASQGNALFGQWTWGEHAMKPEQQREELGNYGLAAYESPQQSVLGYMHNLNTHRVYAELRARRSEARAQGREPSGYGLAATLTGYSERGEDYVKSLHAIMRVNRLNPVDSAYLSPGPATYLVPVGEGTHSE